MFLRIIIMYMRLSFALNERSENKRFGVWVFLVIVACDEMQAAREE